MLFRIQYRETANISYAYLGDTGHAVAQLVEALR